MNSIIALFENTWTEALGWTLLHSLWIGALVCLLWRLSLLGKRSPNWRYLSSLIALASLFVLVMSTFAWELSQLTPTDVLAQTIGTESNTQAPSSSPAEAPALTSDSWLDGLSEWITPYFPWISLAWISGIILLSLRLLGGWLYLEYLRRSGRHSVPLQWQKQVETLSIAMNIRRKVQLIESNLLDHPITMGFFKPIILFPLGMISQMPPEQIEAIILHELAHIKRADYLVNYFQSIVEIILFFHPAVWWISQDLRESREHCCDDLALAQGFDRWQYAQALLQLTKTNISSKTILAMSLTGNKHSQLSRRIHRLFGRYTPDRFMSRGLLMAILLSASLMTWAFHSAPIPEIAEGEETAKQVQKQKHLFTIFPSTSIEEVEEYNQILREYGYELESIVRSEEKQIIRLTIDKVISEGYPLGVTKLERVAAYLNLDQEEHLITFQVDGVFSFEWEEEETEAESEIVAIEEEPINDWVAEPAEQEVVVTGSPVVEGDVLDIKQEEQESMVSYLIRGRVASKPKPLYVINGELMDDRNEDEVKLLIEEIMNTEEVDHINVLKGPAAVAKYGEKAEVGVVEFILKNGSEAQVYQAAISGKTYTAVNGVLLSPQPEGTHSELIGRLSQPKKIRGIEVYAGERATNLFGPETEAGVHNFIVREKADEPGIIAELYGNADHGLFDSPPSPLILLNGKPLSDYGLSTNFLLDELEGSKLKFREDIAEDIKSIEVYKAPRAVSLFGDEAINGAVDIQMKKAAIADLMDQVSTNDFPSQSLPTSQGLQIFPNPSSEVVFLRFELPMAAKTKIWVSDLSGKRVLEIINIALEQGSHEVEFDINTLASGTYIMHLSYGDQLLQRKFMIK